MSEDYGHERRTELARQVRIRRGELGLSVEDAAKAGGISAPTWSRVESGSRAQNVSYRAVERALGWELGRADEIMANVAGAPPFYPSPKIPGVEAMDDPLVARILASPLPDEDKVELVHMALRERRRADETTSEALEGRVTAWKRWMERLRGSD